MELQGITSKMPWLWIPPRGKPKEKAGFSPHCGDETITYYDRSTSTPRCKPPYPPGKTEAMQSIQKLMVSRTTAGGSRDPHDAACLWENGMPHLEMPPNQRGWRRGMQKGRCGRPFFLTALPGMYPAHPHDMFNIVHLYLI